jgi:hypothetical protein
MSFISYILSPQIKQNHPYDINDINDKMGMYGACISGSEGKGFSLGTPQTLPQHPARVRRPGAQGKLRRVRKQDAVAILGTLYLWAKKPLFT